MPDRSDVGHGKGGDWKMATDLAREIETFDRLLPSLLKDEGKFAVIKDDELIGVFEGYADALTAGYLRAGLDNSLLR